MVKLLKSKDTEKIQRETEKGNKFSKEQKYGKNNFLRKIIEARRQLMDISKYLEAKTSKKTINL